jgi:Protein of unknown function (DUF2934)
MAEEDLEEQIQHRAYEIWLSEGCPLGRERIHWVRAEAEFREKLATANRPCRSGLHETPAPDRFQQVPRSTADISFPKRQ